MTARHGLSTQLRGVSSLCAFRAPIAPAPRRFSAACQRNQNQAPKTEEKNESKDAPEEEKDSAMSRRLAQMTEDAMLEGGRSARRNIENVGFSEELKKQLEERVAAAAFKSEHAAAHSIVDMPVCNPHISPKNNY
jgi:hypothetical protein